MSRKLTKEEFVEKAREVHGYKYDYSKVEYKNATTKVCIICPVHGEFLQKPNYHTQGNGCPKCAGKRMDTKLFIEYAHKEHGDKYDYSKVVYKKSKDKVCIICPVHGEFYQTPNSHLQGQGCLKCGVKSRSKLNSKTDNIFIEQAKKVHNNKYDYSKVEYKNIHTKVCIICPDHGEFYQTPGSHLRGVGCPKCSSTSKLTTEKFIEKAREVHGDKYDYSKVEYKNVRDKVCIICPEHGEFYQTPNTHFRGNGCSECSGKAKLTTKKFIEKAREVHNNKYDYSKVEYKSNTTKVCIICPEHGEFYQTPNTHLRGSGCPRCIKNTKLTTEDFIERSRKVHGNKYDYDRAKYKNSATKVCIICPDHGEFFSDT
jgi:hypothetical protein